jgi:DNA-binding CsgD family transcriptional regulator
VPWIDRLVDGELEFVEYTARVITHVGSWTPAHCELRRLLSVDGDATIAVTLTLVGDFKETIAEGVLTPREVAVVAALFDGRRVPQIAAHDGVSVKTLRNQLTAVYRKLGVADQGELLEAYHRPATGPPTLPRALVEAWGRPSDAERADEGRG